MENPTKHGFTFYLLTAYAPAVSAPAALMAHDGISLAGHPGMALSFAVLYGALIGLVDRELLEPARNSPHSSPLGARLASAFGLCALAGVGLYTVISALTAS